MGRFIAAAAFAAWLSPFLKFLQWFFNVVGGVDLAVERIRDPGWIGSVVNWCAAALTRLLDFPPWSYPVMILAGIALLWLDRRIVAGNAASANVAAANAIPNESSADSTPAIAIAVTNVNAAIGELVSLSAVSVTNVGGVPLAGCIVKAELFRAVHKPDASSMAIKAMEGIPSPLVLRTEGQLRNRRPAGRGFNLRIGESKNIVILWRNKNGKGPRFLIAEDGTRYAASSSFETTIAVYGAGVPTRKRLSIGIGDSVETSLLLDAQEPPGAA